MADEDVDVKEEAVELEEMELGGEKYTVSKKFAEALRVANEVKKPEEKKLETPVQEPDEFAVDPTEFVQRPGDYLKKFEQRIEERLQKKYQTERAKENWWSEFYRENPDLRDVPELVETRLQKDLNDLAPMKPEVARKELAKKVKDDIIRITSKFAPKAETPETATLEGSHSKSQAKVKKVETEDDGPKSLGDVIRERRKRRGY